MAGRQNLIGGNFFDAGDASFAVTTDLATCSFVESVSNGAAGFSFIGFQAGAGEYFTSVPVSGSGSVSARMPPG